MTAAPVVTPREHDDIAALVSGLSAMMFSTNTWDEDPPQLWSVINDGAPDAFGRVALMPVRIPVPDEAWTIERPPGVVRATALALHHGNPPPPSIDVRAVVLGTECWTLDIPPDATEEQKAEAWQFAGDRRTADHPWAVEAKNAMAVGADGWSYNSVRLRGSGRELVHQTGPEGLSISGAIPAALALLLLVLRGDS
jgi:hypothetical protein